MNEGKNMDNIKIKIAILGSNSFIARNMIHYINHFYQNRFDLLLYDYQDVHFDGADNYHTFNLMDYTSFSKDIYDCDLIYLFSGKTGTR